MALYTCFVHSPRLTQPITNELGITRVFAQADVVMLDAQSTPVSPWGMPEPWAAYCTLQSTDAVAAGDSMASLKTKILSVVRPNYPSIETSDFIRVVWLDDSGLLNL